MRGGICFSRVVEHALKGLLDFFSRVNVSAGREVLAVNEQVDVLAAEHRRRAHLAFLQPLTIAPLARALPLGSIR
jgi:hypothetical protein